jgi:hypothetical protein
LQQSCLSVEVSGGTFACGELCEEEVRDDVLCDAELCIGQASSALAVAMLILAVLALALVLPLALAALLAFAEIDVAFLLGVEACAAIGNAADVVA